ncbi:lysylphosphatidylglycerol synthase domain-containing protein [Litoreibacter roseus]|uniref:Lysylphosphatidylglycerol synthase-like protein n=1 Tax=Litoreibacter roseus TaxID=2601869 RepID=A0A6N6JLZ1_9RHOB|nr:lysylphosphatidylglycerol synthase domain-containing protein [Litoreibacter roseus]GFE66212.1 hypothetical protein KIN_32860 [Litoreibacter roseus]
MRTASDVMLLWLGFFAGWTIASVPLTLACAPFQALWIALGSGLIGAVASLFMLRSSLSSILLEPAVLSANAEAPLPAIAYLYMAVVQAGIVSLAALKWKMVLAETRVSGQSIPLGAAVAATANGALIGQTISIQVSTPIVRAWVARRFGISARAAAGTSLFEQSLELVTLGIVATASVVMVAAGGALPVALIVVFGLIVLVTIAIRPILAALTKALVRAGTVLPARLGKFTKVIADGLSLAAAQNRSILARLMNLSLLRYLLLLGLNLAIVKMILPQIPLLPLVQAFPLILLVSSLPFLPAGLGATELTWASVLILNGADAAGAAETALALRVVSLASFLLVYPYLAFNERVSAVFARNQR